MSDKISGTSLILFFLLILSSCSSSHDGGGGCKVPGPVATAGGWTVLVYMAGDNNLSNAAVRDLDEMASVGSSEKVRVVVQRDLSDDGVRRLVVGKGCEETIEDLGEINSAAPEPLEDFIVWAAGAYPSDRLALVLWDHGDGHAKPRANRGGPYLQRMPYGILQDDTDGVSCCLSILSVRQAMEDAGVYFDLLGFDASMMGQEETAYEFRNTADVLVFSQESGQENGWDYTAILSRLKADPLMEAPDLAEEIVTSYRDFYEDFFYPANPDYDPFLTISAIPLGSSQDTLAGALDAVSGDLLASLDQPDVVTAISDARAASQNMNTTFCNLYTDLFDWVDAMLLQPGLDAGTLADLADLKALEAEVIQSEYHGVVRPGAHGLSIVFHANPNPACSNFDPEYLAGTSGHAFVEDTHWDEFLSDYFVKAGLT